MARRKGWDQLSPAYRRRLQRNNITRAAYEAGASLSTARGHRPNEFGVSETRASILRRLIRSTDSWAKDDNPTEIVANTIGVIGYEATVARLFRKAGDYSAYHKGGISGPGTPGYIHWHNRKIYISEHMYWYH